jgi:hypothetical protein
MIAIAIAIDDLSLKYNCSIISSRDDRTRGLGSYNDRLSTAVTPIFSIDLIS